MKLVITVLRKIHLVIDGGIKRIVMSETAIKQKVSAWSIPGVINDDILPGEKVFDSLIENFDDKQILKAILTEFNITGEWFFSGRQKQEIVIPMHFYRFFLRSIKGQRKPGNCKPLKYSLNKIGIMTGCSHATVIWSYKTAQNLIQTNKECRAKYEAVLSKLPRYVFALKKLY